MLMLVFSAGEDRYGIDVRRIIEVAPVVKFRPSPHSPDYVAGLVNYRGAVTPVIDMTSLLTGVASRLFYSTRIILSWYNPGGTDLHILGLMAEHATDTCAYREEDLRSSGIKSEKAGYLGKILSDNGEIIQLIDPSRILPDEVRRILFTEE